MAEDTECPICAEQLKLSGGLEVLRAFSIPTGTASSFGSDIVSLECGHRLHRFCLVRWLQTAQIPSCPTCRSITEWVPTLEEQQQILPLMQQGWKVLAPREKTVIKFVWVLAALACLTDPIVLIFMSFFFVAIMPPIFFPSAFLMIVAAKQSLEITEPGSRMFYALGIATAITIATLLHNTAMNNTEHLN